MASLGLAVRGIHVDRAGLSASRGEGGQSSFTAMLAAWLGDENHAYFGMLVWFLEEEMREILGTLYGEIVHTA